jgi:hypothetical protein
MGRLLRGYSLLLMLGLSGCAGPVRVADFSSTEVKETDRVIFGRLKVYSFGKDVTTDCKVWFRPSARNSALILPQDGFFAQVVGQDHNRFYRMICRLEGGITIDNFQHLAYEGVAAGSTTYIGDMLIQRNPAKDDYANKIDWADASLGAVGGVAGAAGQLAYRENNPEEYGPFKFGVEDRFDEASKVFSVLSGTNGTAAGTSLMKIVAP